MADWTCTYHISVGITASNEDKAAERLSEVQDMIQLMHLVKGKWTPFNPTWLGDMELGDMELEEA